MLNNSHINFSISIPTDRLPEVLIALGKVLQHKPDPEPVEFTFTHVGEEQIMNVDFQAYKLTVKAAKAKDVVKRELIVTGEPGSRVFVGGAEGSRTVLTIDDTGSVATELAVAGEVVTDLGLEEQRVFGGELKATDNADHESSTSLFNAFKATDTVPPDAPEGTLENVGEETIDVQ